MRDKLSRIGLDRLLSGACMASTPNQMTSPAASLTAGVAPLPCECPKLCTHLATCWFVVSGSWT